MYFGDVSSFQVRFLSEICLWHLTAGSIHDDCGSLMGDLNTIVASHSIIIPYAIPAGVNRKKPKILSGKKPIETDKDTIKPSMAP